VSVDLITKLPRSLCYDGLTYDSIATFVCMLTKQAIFVRINETITAQQLANVFIDHVYSKHGLPTILVSDRDPRFNSHFWRSLFTALGTKLNMSTAYHPQTDGQTEVTHRTIEQILRAYVHPCHDDWSTWLPLAEFAYNSQYHRSTHTSPFFANYGFHPSSPASFLLPPDASPDASDYLDNLRDIQQSVARELELEKAINSDQANRHRRDLRFQPGDQVRLSTEFLSLLNQPSSKLRSRYLGPFTVLDTVPSNCPNAVSYKLDLPASMSRIHPVFHVSRLLPWIPNPADNLPTRTTPPQPLPAATEYIHGDAYTVDRMLDVKIMPDPESRARPRADNIFFLVRWAAPYQDPSHDSWEPYRNLKRLDAIKSFLRSPAY
jgi:transposase InsO family protein